MRIAIVPIVLSCLTSIVAFSQPQPLKKANYAQAAKFSPKRLEKMLFSTNVDPHWLKNTNRFWYMYETTAGRKWWLVDAARGTRQPLFDNDSLAAALTRIVKDPFDAQHLGIENLRLRDDKLTFDLKSSLDVERKDTARKAAPRSKPSSRPRQG